MKYTKFAAIAAGTMIAVGGAAAPAFADSEATGGAAHSPGLLSGDILQTPVHLPGNVCGDTGDASGALNPAFGNTCANVSN